MAKTSYINVRADENIKKEAELILSSLGLTPSDAINLLYNQIILNKGLPFEIKIPNSVTIKAIDDLENNIDVQEYNSPDAYFKARKQKTKK